MLYFSLVVNKNDKHDFEIFTTWDGGFYKMEWLIIFAGLWKMLRTWFGSCNINSSVGLILTSLAWFCVL